MKLINNVGPLNEAKSFHAQLQPVVNALDRLQSDNVMIVNDCEEWLRLLRADALKPYLPACRRPQGLVVIVCVSVRTVFVRKISQERVHGSPPNLVGGSRG